MSPPSLPTLLARPLVAFRRDAQAVDVRPQFRLSLWANLLRLLDGGDVPQREVRPRSRLSRRAVTPIVTAFTRWGWVTVDGEGRRKVLRLTAEGRGVAGAWRPVPATIEDRWRSDLGADRVDRLRAALAALVGRLPLELPHYPATYGAVDQTIASGLGVAVMTQRPLTPGVEHGADWRPIPRTGGGEAVAGLPLCALLSQALVAFALDYEAGDHGPFEVAATVLRHVGDDGTPLIPPRFPSGLPRKAAYNLPRFRLAVVERDPASRVDVVHLTDRGRAWRDAYEPAVARVTEGRAAKAAHETTPLARRPDDLADPPKSGARPPVARPGWGTGSRPGSRARTRRSAGESPSP